jgi:HAD superfamily hydrolase (TIGR01509 family)
MIVPGRHRCVLFDVDGTIAETEGHGHLPAFNRALAEAGLPWRWSRSDYRRLLKTAGGYERLLHFAEEAGHDPDAMAELLGRVHKAKNRHFAEILASGAVPPRAGFHELVMALARNGIAWGVVTTTSRANWKALWTCSLAPLQLPEPAVIVCGEDVALKKPDPEAYVIALERLGMPPTRCCAIEDSRNGMLAARLAGLAVAIVKSEFFADERFDEAAVVVEELTALVPGVSRGENALA